MKYLCENCKHNVSDYNEEPCSICGIDGNSLMFTTKEGWIPCELRLPDNEQEVEVTYVNKHWKTGEPLYFTCRAFYTDGTMNTEESDYTWNEIDNLEYNEKLDAYIIPEGWWECVSFAEEYAAVDLSVIAWMPLPEPYKG